MNKKALIAMSGGVDSSVAALLMREKGYSCIGATMKLFDNKEDGSFYKKTCCSLDDVEEARSIASSLGIPYYVFNFTDDFTSDVIAPFISSYENGSTPNPCIECNRHLKFEKLYQRALMMGCDSVVTGHYARIVKEKGRYLLKKAKDRTKDQSYALYFLTGEQLTRTRFPLGDLPKTEIRKIAEANRFVNAGKPDSQDICFVPDGNYSRFIERVTGKEYPPGDFLNRKGDYLGKHRGIIHYTIGQRKGLGLPLGVPMYVLEKRFSDNTVILGRDDDLLRKELDAKDVNWIAFETPPKEFRTKAKVRYGQREDPATVYPIGDHSFHLIFDRPQRAIAKGQAVVLYDGDTVIGGGTIC